MPESDSTTAIDGAFESLARLDKKIDDVLAERTALLDALRIAVDAIKIWHGGGELWELYQASPEMRLINAAIALAEGRS